MDLANDATVNALNFDKNSIYRLPLPSNMDWQRDEKKKQTNRIDVRAKCWRKSNSEVFSPQNTA